MQGFHTMYDTTKMNLDMEEELRNNYLYKGEF